MNRLLLLCITSAALTCHAETEGLLPNALETVSVFSSAALTASQDKVLDLHSAVEELFYEPSSSTRANARNALENAYDAYLQSELYGLIGNDGASETHRLINAVSVSNCEPDYAADGSVMGLIAGLEEGSELTADKLYAMQANVEGGATGFRVVQFLLASSQGGEPERINAYMLACAELLARNESELQELRLASDILTTGDQNANISSVLSAVILQSERNLALLANPDCSNDMELSRIIAQNVSGLYQLWIGEFSGYGNPGISGTGLKAVAENQNSELAARIDTNTRMLFNAARLLGNKKIRQDKDQHLAAFSSRTRDKIAGLLDEQVSLWTTWAGEGKP